MRFVCLLFGHRPLSIALIHRGVLQTLRDSTGTPLVEIVLCRRCRGVYWRLPQAVAEEDKKTP